MTTTDIVPPVTYQGAKVRLADEIAAALIAEGRDHYYDLCCGSGAVSLALIRAGVRPSSIHMCDLSPWGAVWAAMGAGKFRLKRFAQYCDWVGSDPETIHGFMVRLARAKAVKDIPYRFLLLQAAAFGGKAIAIKGRRWCDSDGNNPSFRRYWTPTKTSNRRSPVNPMMPMPGTILARCEALVESVRGLQCVQADIVDMRIRLGHKSVVYIDPPYEGTAAYLHEADWMSCVDFARNQRGAICFVSEGKPLSEEATMLSAGRAKGGVSGKRSSANEEWLNIYR